MKKTGRGQTRLVCEDYVSCVLYILMCVEYFFGQQKEREELLENVLMLTAEHTKCIFL